MTNKLDSHIIGDMIDNLLPEQQKPKALGGATFREDSIADFFEDDGPDPMDAGYSPKKTTSSSRRTSVFDRAEKHTYVRPVPFDKTTFADARVRELIAKEGVRVGDKLLFEPKAWGELVMRFGSKMAEALEPNDLMWSAKGAAAFRKFIKEWMESGEVFAGQETKGRWERIGRVEQVKYDPETGEILEEDDDGEGDASEEKHGKRSMIWTKE